MKGKRKWIASAVSLAMILGCMALPVSADGVTYVNRSWDSEQKKVVSTVETCQSYSALTSIAPESGWYYVNETIGEGLAGLAVWSSITIGSGKTVNIILGDNAKINTGTIIVQYGATLNIYAENVKDAGKIQAIGSSNSPGIGGGSKNHGNINIYGGTIEATGGENCAGIGTCDEDNYNHALCGIISIYGGNITAKGGEDGAGIGGGEDADAGSIVIYGGKITATGGSRAAGIGSGYDPDEDEVGIIKIHGGEITATGGSNAAGIGSGKGGVDTNIKTGSVTITGGTIKAQGGVSAAGIGSGDDTDCGMTISIKGGDITATGGINPDSDSSYGAAGIGSGASAELTGTISISGGKVTANGSGKLNIVDPYAVNGKREHYGGAGIGAGHRGNVEKNGKIIISGGEITAVGAAGAAAIGAGSDSNDSSHIGSEMEGTIAISGGKLNLSVTNSETRTPFVGQGINGDPVADGNITLATSFEVHYAGQEPVLAADRVSTCKSYSTSDSQVLVIQECAHQGTYTPAGSEKHHLNCKYCGYECYQNHTIENGRCAICGYNQEYDVPTIIGYGMRLDGKITLEYFVGLPSDMTPASYDQLYMTFEGNNMDSTKQYPVSSEKSPKANGYVVELDICAIQMADKFTPTIHYSLASGGNVSTAIGEPFCAQDYISYGLSKFSGSDLAVVKALADYGYYSQKYLSEINGWTIGDQYAEVTVHDSDYSNLIWTTVKSAASNYKLSVENGGDISSATYSMKFGSEISIVVYLTPANGQSIDTVTVDGKTVTPRKSGDKYIVTIPGIKVTELKKNHTVVYGNYSMTVSPLSYAYDILTYGTRDSGKNLVCAMAKLANACQEI